MGDDRPGKFVASDVREVGRQAGHLTLREDIVGMAVGRRFHFDKKIV
jgi:hypothetical protein